MTGYYALWIPTVKIGKIVRVDPPARRKIQDDKKWKPYFLWGEVNKSNYDFTLWYSRKDSKEKAKSLRFIQTGQNKHGFIIYALEFPEDETDRFVDVLKKGMTPSVYHFIKDHFHEHVHHESNEDALLACLFSNEPLTLDSAEGKREIAGFYLDTYAVKFSNFLEDVKGAHIRARLLVNSHRFTSKGISLYSDTIKDGRILLGEYEYCEFLMKHYADGRAQKNKEIRACIDDIRRELEAISFEYQLSTNTYNIRLALLGIWAGIIGIVIGVLGIWSSSNSQTDFSPVIQHVDSIAVEQHNLIQKIDSSLNDVGKSVLKQNESNRTLIKN